MNAEGAELLREAFNRLIRQAVDMKENGADYWSLQLQDAAGEIGAAYHKISGEHIAVVGLKKDIEDLKALIISNETHPSFKYLDSLKSELLEKERILATIT